MFSTGLFSGNQSINDFYWEVYNSNTQENTGLRIVRMAEGFLGQAYVGGVLERNETESCVINPFELDCVTMIEQAIALARVTEVSKENIIEKLNWELTLLRYRNGEIDGYLSRLHYSKDWALDNIKKGICQDVSKKIGGVKYDKEINFMSSHPQYYRQLKDDKNLISKIKKIENEINQKEIYYIPKDKLTSDVLGKIKSGDLIFFTTNVSGLDYSHLAIARRSEGEEGLGIIHASTIKKKVVAEESLLDYINSVKKHSGITILRVK